MIAVEEGSLPASGRRAATSSAAAAAGSVVAVTPTCSKNGAASGSAGTAPALAIPAASR
ncbi:MAG: hypothetical protein ACJ74U_07500 [Jatrophihabitantaceae bacterium]